MVKLKREIKISSAFDRRDETPGKDYGIGSCRIFFIVKGGKGAVTVSFFTNWYLPSTLKEYKEEGIYKNNIYAPRDNFKTKIDLIATTNPIGTGSWDIHSKKKLYDGQTLLDRDCEFTGGKCYCDGSSLMADEYLQLLFEKGSDGVFERLEEDYNKQFAISGSDE